MTINWYEGFFDKLYIEWQNSSEVNYQKKCFLDAQNIYNLLNISQEEKILDLCCGCGFHSSQFADLGNSVVGIDLSKEMISTAKKNFNNKKIKFISQDIRTEINNYKFDIAFCLNTSIGYFEDNIDLIKVFDNVYRCLNTKGKFVVDLFNPFKFCKEFIQHLSFNIDNFRIEQYSNLDLIKQEVTNCILQ
ncbi:class I SAM-dependent methyltransferase [Metabacillus halosaccharovorans]|uniref:class I SAM-dependent methyltransferase n=1 Tax=Metabacillus halosaccharovorans TaxID=930124 RepID=UPI00203BECA2|nr:class I SAM-dependent methyltransferase [Metabacillus halosaccharovorans]MCM3444714.1 class I SAM-dependent methyltransferase [Metabacillus halosaccharovorans]